MNTASPFPRKLTPISQPISLLATTEANVYTHIHPILLLSLYYLRFSSLVASPVPTLLSSLIPLSILQITYTVLCLPPTASGSRSASTPSKKAKGKRGATTKGHGGIGAKIVPSLLSLALTMVLAAPLLTVVLVLFGAPLTTHLPHTSLCATHIALLSILPLFYVYGVDGKMWREISSASLPFDEVWGGCIGSILGAWLGAVPIPLDWDREWQKWPVTIVTGAYLGFAVGRFAGAYLLRGKRIEFD